MLANISCAVSFTVTDKRRNLAKFYSLERPQKSVSLCGRARNYFVDRSSVSF